MPEPPSDLLRTKLARPQLRQDVIERPRLLARLRRNPDRALTLVCAPAGAGKSTLVVQWLHDDPRPVAWLALEPTEAQLDAFCVHLLAAIQSVYPRSCAALQDLLRAAAPLHEETLVPPLINGIADLPGDLLLVLDDYHVVRDPLVHRVITRLVARRPPQLHMVVISRQEPPLQLDTFRGLGQITEVRQRDLRFAPDEIAAFVERVLNGAPSAETVALLEARTEGWGVGIRLAVLAVDSTEQLAAAVQEMRGTQPHTAGYLATEVLARQSARAQRFLLYTSILDQMCGPLCSRLLDADADIGADTVAAEDKGGGGSADGSSGVEDAENAGATLSQMEAAHLFLVALDGERTWFRYHPLFRDMLRARLEATASPAQIAALQRRAGRWYAEQGLVEEAVRYLLAGGDADGAAAVIEQNASRVLNRLDRRTLEEWLARLPLAQMENRPRLLLLRAWVHHFAMREGQIPPLLARVRALVTAQPELNTPDVQASLHMFDCLLAWQAGDAEATIDAGSRALAALPAAETCGRGIAFVYTCSAMQMAGRAAEARAAAQRAMMQLAEPLDAFGLRVLMAGIAIPLFEGWWEEAAEVAQLCLVRARQAQLPLGAAWGHFCMGTAAFERSQYEAALQHYGAILEAPFAAHMRTVYDAAYATALVQQFAGASAQADRALAVAHEMALQSGSLPAMAEVRSVRARVLLARGEPDKAAHLLPQPLPTTTQPRVLYSLEMAELTTARTLVAVGDRGQLAHAQELLEATLHFVRRIHSARFAIDTLLITAHLQVRRQKESAALALIEQALQLAEPRGSRRPFLELGRPLLPHLRQLHARGAAPLLLPAVLASLRDPKAPPAPAAHTLVEPLTSREMDVLTLLAQRLSDQEISDALVVAPTTVRTHLNHLYGKLGASSRRDAVLRARACGLIA